MSENIKKNATIKKEEIATASTPAKKGRALTVILAVLVLASVIGNVILYTRLQAATEAGSSLTGQLEAVRGQLVTAQQQGTALQSQIAESAAKLEELETLLAQLQEQSMARMMLLVAKETQTYDERIRSIQKLLNSIDRKCLTLPPYSLAPEEVERHHNQLFCCLNRHRHLFTDTPDCRDESGMLVHFLPISPLDLSETEKNQREVLAINEDILRTLAPYIQWLDDIRRVKAVYAKLLTEFLHSKHTFLSPQEIAAQFQSCWQQEDDDAKPYQRLGTPQPVSVSHEVFSPEKGSPIVAESYIFNNLGAFLYTDFFRGLKNNYLPQKCANCKEWFLLRHGQYSDYCNRSTFQKGKDETCRSIGARGKYNKKCKTDPVWLAYNRAYKAHYARLSKGKITRAEFERWGIYAISLRTQALEGNLSFEEYQQLLKK